MWNGRIYVCDVRGKGIFVLDLRSKQTRIMGSTGMGALTKAVDVTVAPDGVKYVADLGKQSIVVYDPDERFVQTFDLPDFNPVGLAVYGNQLYACDFKSQTVKVLDRFTGKLLRSIGEPGGEDGQFIRPLAIACDPQGNIVVADVMKARVQKFTPDGKLIWATGQPGNRPGDLVRPKHLAVDKQGITYVVDAAFNNVQLFDEEGKVMMYFGSVGSHPGSMDLPAGLWVHDGDMDLFKDYIHPAFEAKRLLVVTNQFGPNRVAVYALGQLREGKTLADLSQGRIGVAPGLAEQGEAIDPTTTRPVEESEGQKKQ